MCTTIFPLLSSSKTEKVKKQTKMADASEQRQISKKQMYMRREEEEDRREITSYIDYLYISSLLCNSVLRRTGGTKLVITQSKAGIIEMSYNF